MGNIADLVISKDIQKSLEEGLLKCKQTLMNLEQKENELSRQLLIDEVKGEELYNQYEVFVQYNSQIKQKLNEQIEQLQVLIQNFDRSIDELQNVIYSDSHSYLDSHSH